MNIEILEAFKNGNKIHTLNKELIFIHTKENTVYLKTFKNIQTAKNWARKNSNSDLKIEILLPKTDSSI